MPHQNITTQHRLLEYCRELAQAPTIAFDTEFVSEHTYRPVLCLVQVAAGDQLAVIDPLAVEDMNPFWEVIAQEGHTTIVHAGRGEVEFCLQAIGRLPAGLFDVQIAAGLVGVEYPAGYNSIVSKLLGAAATKHETRTDWRRRPLSLRQMDYALDDVRYLHPLRDVLLARLDERGRREWFVEEMTFWLAEVERSLFEERWRRVAGTAGLDRRGLAVVRALWQWREDEADRRNQPVRRVLRDDLIVELARRASADVKRIAAVRGLERGDLRRRLDDMAASIEAALQLPADQCPEPLHRERTPELPVLGQFLFAALGSICRQADLAPNVVGTPNDIRELIVYRTKTAATGQRVPRLARGWRALFVGQLFEDLLSGKISVRVGDATSESPLLLETNHR